jgi:D-amino peptidase
MRRIIPICALLLLAASVTQAQPEELKIYISVDMEGIGGVSTWDVQAGSEGSEYEKFRKLMTAEANAAIQAAFDAGATQVLVSDSHGNGQNLDIELLDKRVRLIRAWPRPLLMMQGLDSTFDAAVFIGYHAREGQSKAVLAHTMSSRGVFEIKLNETVVPETGFNAAIAGDFGVPVGDIRIGRSGHLR